MNILFKKYRDSVKIIFVFTTFIFILVLNCFVFPYAMESHDKGGDVYSRLIIFLFFAVGSLYLILFILSLYFYEKLFWKISNSRYNFSGYWKMSVFYNHLERKADGMVEFLNLPYKFDSVFKIDQSISEFHFSEGFSAPNEVWRDRSLRLTEDGLNMSYEVTRADKVLSDPLPPRMIGYEVVAVLDRDSYGRPIYMEGELFHAALPGTALYRGKSIYERILKEEYRKLLYSMRSRMLSGKD